MLDNLKIINPATEAVIGEVVALDDAAIRQRYTAAKTELGRWRSRAYSERARIVQRFRSLLADQTEVAAATLTAEVGKPLAQSRGEIKGTLGRIDFFLGEAEARMAEKVVQHDASMTESISFEPLGVVGNISAWNYPYFVGANVFVPALLTGNVVLYKPSEHATLTGRLIGQMWREAGLPASAFQVIEGSGAAGASILAHKLGGVFFTGSYSTGCKIAAAAATQLQRVQLELGGKDPVYVRADVDPKAAAEATADGVFYNAGQSCCAVERLYVHADIYTAFVDHFVAFSKTIVMGDPLREGVYLGPLTRKSQLDILEAQVREAVGKGAKLQLGGQRQGGTGYFFPPTVLTNVDHSMTLMREESFGPIIGIQRVTSDREAVQMMNDTDYGLTAGVYTREESAAREILAQIDAGSVYWNCCDRVSPKLPWSGRGHSGLGVTLSTLGIDTFLKPKAWHMRRPA